MAKTKRARKPKEWSTYLKAQARRIWGWDKERKLAKERAKVGVDREGYHRFKCEATGCTKTYLPRDQVQVDHVAEVDNPNGWDTWDLWLTRLFCPASELKILCLTCHNTKTEANQKIRRAARKAKK